MQTTAAAPRHGPYSARREHLDHAFHCVRLASFATRWVAKALANARRCPELAGYWLSTARHHRREAARWLHEAANHRHAAQLATILGARS